MKPTLRLRILVIVIITLLVWSHVIWDYFHGGVPTHYLLHDDRLPGIPNWWGAVILPFFTWFLLYRIQKRIDGLEMPVASESLPKILLRFLAAVLVAVAIAVCFVYGIEVTDYIMGSLFVLAFFFPLYKSEYLLGWVLGAAFTFGAIIPMGFGSLLALIFFIFYHLGKTMVGFFRSKTK